MVDIKKFAITGATVLLAITIILSIVGSIIPTVQTSAQGLNESALCAARGACRYNTTASATAPCRSSANQSNICPGTTDGADQAPAVFDLFDSPTAVIFTILAVVVLTTTIGIAFKLGKK